MPENKDKQFDNKEENADFGQASGAQNPQTGDKPEIPRQGESGGGQGQQSSGQGQATATQRQPDDEASNRQSQSTDENRTGGQSKQPGLPDSKNEEWSPGSGQSER